MSESSNNTSKWNRLVWIDCEMTGLDHSRDKLVEIACIVTDAELQPLDEGVSFVIRCEPELLENLDDVVHAMHTASGLLPLIPEGISVAEAEKLTLAYIQQWVPEAKQAPLAGSSVYVDRMFLSREMPELDAYLHYRLIDVSSIKELARRWYQRSYFASPEKVGNHRALGDILDSIRELQYYREAVLVPAPGPDTDTARTIAQSLTPTP